LLNGGSLPSVPFDSPLWGVGAHGKQQRSKMFQYAPKGTSLSVTLWIALESIKLERAGPFGVRESQCEDRRREFEKVSRSLAGECG